MTRLPQSRLALVTGVLLVAPLLASCGFDYATDRVNTLSAGVSDRDGEVDVLGAVIVAGEADSGVLLATLVNNSNEEPAGFAGVTATEAVSPAGEPQSVEIPRGGRLTLVDEGGVPVTGTFAPGDFVDVTLSFDGGQVTTLQVNVVPPCRQYSPETIGIEVEGDYDCEPLPAVDPHAESDLEGSEPGGSEPEAGE